MHSKTSKSHDEENENMDKNILNKRKNKIFLYTFFKMLNWIFGLTLFGYLFPHDSYGSEPQNGVAIRSSH